MIGYVNYYYKDGNPPSHTKPAFADHKILTIHGIIVKNALLFMHKVRYLPLTLPQSVRDTISVDSPREGSDHVTCNNWLEKYSNCYYNRSLFFKGPLLAVTPAVGGLVTTTSLFSIIPFKNNVCRMLLNVQAQGDSNEWQPENFILQNIHGLRRSTRQ